MPPRSLHTLRSGGLLVTAVVHNPGLTTGESERYGVRFATVLVQPSGANLTSPGELADAGRLRVHVERVLPLADAAEAHMLAATKSAKGKTVPVP